MSTSIVVMGSILLLAVLQLVLQKYTPLFSAVLSIAAALFLLLRIGIAFQTTLRGMAALAQHTDGQAFSVLFRCTGILLLTDYVRTLCEEAGADSLGWCAGLAGRCLVLTAAFPLLEEVCQKIWRLAG